MVIFRVSAPLSKTQCLTLPASHPPSLIIQHVICCCKVIYLHYGLLTSTFQLRHVRVITTALQGSSASLTISDAAFRSVSIAAIFHGYKAQCELVALMTNIH